MMKRLLFLLTALTLLGASMAAAEDVALPMHASDCPIRLEDVVPMSVAEIPMPDVRLTPDDLPVVTSLSRRASRIYFTLSGPCEFDQLSGELSFIHNGKMLRVSEAEVLASSDERRSIRFDLPEEAIACRLYSVTLRGSYAGEDHEAVASIVYQCGKESRVSHSALRVMGADGDFTCYYNHTDEGDVLNRYAMEGPNGFLAEYDRDGLISYAYVRTEHPAREYHFDGSGMLWSLDDVESGLSLSYDMDSGVLDGYELNVTEPDTQNDWEVRYTPYGTVEYAVYDLASPEGEIKGYEWSPEDGWMSCTKAYEYAPVDAEALGLPDIAAMAPPLPAAELPEFRLDVSSAADLPRLPIESVDLPKVLELRVENGLATVLLDRPLLMEGGCLRVCDWAWHWGGVYTDVIAAATTDDGLTYTAAVPEDTDPNDVCLDFYIPAADASRFSVRYLYDPDEALWEVHLDSPAAGFAIHFTSDGSVSRASFGNYLTSLINHSYLTFDEATGRMTEYLWYVESPFDDTGWYQILYVPGEGVVNARVGEGEGLFYEWKPETGWLDCYDGEPADIPLLDPMAFPHPYPFPQNP